MINSVTTQPNKISSNKYENRASIQDRNEFTNILDTLNDSVTDKEGQSYEIKNKPHTSKDSDTDNKEQSRIINKHHTEIDSDTDNVGQSNEIINKHDRFKDSITDNEEQNEEFEIPNIKEHYNMLLELIYDEEKNHHQEDNSIDSLSTIMPIHYGETLSPALIQESNKSLNVVSVETIQELTTMMERYLLTPSANTKSENKLWLFSYTDNNGINLEFKVQKLSSNNIALSCNMDLQTTKSSLQELNERLNRKGWSLNRDNQLNSYKIEQITHDY
jgi:hypothetical protein